MTKKKRRLLLGAHMSIAGGLDQAIFRGESIGCTTIQIFTKSNRQWAAKKLTTVDIENFKTAQKESDISPVVAHSSYLINLGSPKKDISKKSTKALAIELQRCEELGIPYLVLHPGSCLASSEEKCIEQIAQNLDKALALAPGKTMVLLETMAGQGSIIGYTFEQIAEIIKLTSNKKRVGACLDTCHVFAAGYEFDSKKKYKAMWDNFDATIGLKKLKAIHINDSEKACGTRVDRHADIGKGKISLEAFKLLFNDPRFFDIPKLLETPKESLTDDQRNINTIKKLLTPSTKKDLLVEK